MTSGLFTNPYGCGQPHTAGVCCIPCHAYGFLNGKPRADTEHFDYGRGTALPHYTIDGGDRALRRREAALIGLEYGR